MRPPGRSAPRLALLLPLLLGASDGGGVGLPLHRPETAPPPSEAEALAAVEELLALLDADALTVGWLQEHVRPAHLPDRPGEGWYLRLADHLERGALGEALRSGQGPAAVVPGPDYTRVVLEGLPLLSVVVRTDPAGEVRVDRFEATSCALCEEPARCVRDLIADVGRGGADRLLPFVELDVGSHLEENGGLVQSHWVAMLQTRNTRAGELAWLLEGAEVVAADGDRVTVRYASGLEDVWTVRYRDGSWRVDYAALPEESPLRLPVGDLRTWRTQAHVANSALERWTPDFARDADGLGVRLGQQAVGMAVDPRDGTVLIAVLDLDRTLSGVVRVDPESRAVVERWALPRPDHRTPLAFEGWYERWHAALSPDGRHLAITLPARLWRLDLGTGDATFVARTGEVTALAFGTADDGGPPPLAVAQEHGTVAVYDQGLRWQARLPEPATWLAFGRTSLLALDADGTITALDLGDGAPDVRGRTCEAGATGAALHPDRSELLVGCAEGSRAAAVRLDRLGDDRETIPGVGSPHGGLSFAPNGRFFTTGAPANSRSGLLLWDALAGAPIGRLGDRPVRRVVWSPDGDAILTLDVDGEVWSWDLHASRRRGP